MITQIIGVQKEKLYYHNFFIAINYMKNYIIIIVIIIILFFSSTIASSLIYFFNKSDETETKEIQETTEAQTIPILI